MLKLTLSGPANVAQRRPNLGLLLGLKLQDFTTRTASPKESELVSQLYK